MIVIPLGMYANYSKWIQKEIDGANCYAKLILSVNPWGQERRSSVVVDAAKETVGWNRQKCCWRYLEIVSQFKLPLICNSE